MWCHIICRICVSWLEKDQGWLAYSKYYYYHHRKFWAALGFKAISLLATPIVLSLSLLWWQQSSSHIPGMTLLGIREERRRTCIYAHSSGSRPLAGWAEALQKYICNFPLKILDWSQTCNFGSTSCTFFTMMMMMMMHQKLFTVVHDLCNEIAHEEQRCSAELLLMKSAK